MILNTLASKSPYAKAAVNSSASLTIIANGANLICKRNFSMDEIGKRYGKPYDYKNKKYGLLGQLFDSTLNRLGENSLIITVEGNFGAGKTQFAKELAKKIDFVYAREPDLDYHLYNLPNGNNIREIANEIAGANKKYRYDSIDEWHLQPSFKSTIALQHAYYIIRWMQTRNALLHLMSTGQGVVLERSAFSDSVIAQALYENHLLSDNAWRFYIRDLVPSTLPNLWKPHVMIYLDKSSEDCLKTIQQKGQAHEKQSKVYSIKLLNSVENIYKKTFLPTVNKNLHVLTYQSSEANADKVIEDLEMLNFEDESKFQDWRIRSETIINTYRRTLSDLANCKQILAGPDGYINVPEYLWYGEDYKVFREKLTGDPRFYQDKNAGPFSPIQPINKEKDWF